MRILLIEDEDKVSRFVTLGLNGEQFVVDCAKDGITGYEMATLRPYDVLIVDLMLPRLSGSELISRLRQNRVETPILLLTGRDKLDDVVKNFENGADDYLTKPFAFVELLVRVRSLLRRRQAGKHVAESWGPGNRSGEPQSEPSRKKYPADSKRVRFARVPDGQSRAGFVENDDHRTCLGPEL